MRSHAGGRRPVPPWRRHGPPSSRRSRRKPEARAELRLAVNAGSVLADRQDAEEVFQETFLAALEFSRGQDVRQWPALLQRLATTRAVHDAHVALLEDAVAESRIGGRDVTVLLQDYDQMTLVALPGEEGSNPEGAGSSITVSNPASWLNWVSMPRALPSQSGRAMACFPWPCLWPRPKAPNPFMVIGVLGCALTHNGWLSTI